MKIISTQYSLKYKSLEIVLAGCNGRNGNHCIDCHSPETWDFNIGKDYTQELFKILDKYTRFMKEIQWIWIYGRRTNGSKH